MRVLLTGAAGLDNFITGSPDSIAHLLGHDRFEFVRHNIST